MLQDVLQKTVAGASATGTTLKVLGQAGVIRPHRPLALARVVKVLRDWGTGPAGGRKPAFIAWQRCAPTRHYTAMPGTPPGAPRALRLGGAPRLPKPPPRNGRLQAPR